MTDNLYEQIAKIERDIARLPEGGIAKKTIKGKNNRAIADAFNGIYPVYNAAHNNGFKNWVCRNTEEVL